MKKIIIVIAFVVTSVASFAQMAPRTAYFLDGYPYRHYLNPTFQSARTYFALPVMGGINVATQSTMGVSNFLFPTGAGDGTLTTFMNKSVDAQKFLSDLERHNMLDMDLSMTLFSVGFWEHRHNPNGFSSVSIGLRNNIMFDLPRDLFGMLKNVGSTEHYDFGGMSVKMRSYGEVALGHSQRINEKFTVGGKLKFLVGVASVDFTVDEMVLDMNEDKWSVKGDGSLRISNSGMVIVPTYGEVGKTDGREDEISYDDIDFDTGEGVVGSYGFAADLGVTYEIMDGLKVSTSILDLGFISWKKSTFAKTDEDNVWEFSGFEDVSFEEEDDNYIEDKIDELTDDLEELYKVYKESDDKYKERLEATLVVSGEYRMPFWEHLTGGLLMTAKLDGDQSWVEGRASANMGVGCLGLSVSYGISKFGSTLGTALNLHAKGISFFMGMDAIPLHVTSGTFLPRDNFNVNVNFGIAFYLGERWDKIGYVSKDEE